MPKQGGYQKDTNAIDFVAEVADAVKKLHARGSDLSNLWSQFQTAADEVGCELIKTTARPYGLHFEDTFTGIKYALKVTSKKVSYSRIK